MPSTPLELFTRASDALVQFDAFVNDLKEDELNVYTIQAHLDHLKVLWEKAFKSHDECIEFLNTSESAKRSDIDVASGKYNSVYRSYIGCLANLQFLLEKYKGNQRLNSPSPSETVSSHNLVLPPCDVDTFEGSYLSWPGFRDLFTALYINSSRLSNIEKLCHLLRKTRGEAKDIVEKFPLSDESFDLAWENLRKTYENPRMVVNNQLKILFNLPALDKETCADLKKLQRGINSCLVALSINKISTKDWDPIIVFMCIQRLPSYTVCLWEQSVKDKTAHSLWKDLDSFLTERIRTLECLSSLRSSDSVAKFKETKHYAHTTNTRNACIICSDQSHYLRDCQQFKNLSVVDRISAINANYCCSNCLSSSHLVSTCRSNNNCLICDDRHHTLIHTESSTNTETPATSANHISDTGFQSITTNNNQLPSTSTGITSNRQVFHTRQNASVLLGTATVNLIHNGDKYQVRALIDPASECSFISDKLRKRLKLPTQSTNSKISGVNDTVSYVSRKICSINIANDLNSSIILNTTAFILPSISGSLPSCSINTDITGILPNLHLADPKPFEKRPIEILIGADLYPQIILSGIRKCILGSLLAQETIFGWILTGPIDSTQTNNFSRTNGLENQALV